MKDAMTPEMRAAYGRMAKDKLDLANDKVEEAKTGFLNACGWKHTCQTPGSYWLWTKQISITRQVRQPDLIKGGEFGGWVKNPFANEWREEITTYDALCNMDTAISIQKALMPEPAGSESEK